MTRSLGVFFAVATLVGWAMVFPVYGAVDNYDFSDITVTLTAIKKPVSAIIKDIGRQANYTIEIDGSAEAAGSRSIELDDAALDFALKRVLKNQNYSVVCDDKKKTLSIHFFETSAISRGVAYQQAQGNIALENSAQPEPVTGDSEMAALNQSLEEYYYNMENNIVVENSGQSGSATGDSEMAALNQSLEEYYYNMENNIVVEDSGQSGSATGDSEMAALNQSLEEYYDNMENNIVAENSGQSGSATGDSEMAALNQSLREYYNQQKTKSKKVK